MSEEPTKDSGPQEADIEEFFNQGLHSREESNAGEDPSYPEGTVLEYQKKVSLEDAHKLRLMMSANTAVKKLSIWDISLSALRAAFDKLEDLGSLEELQILSIDCDGEDFVVDFSGAFRKLRVLDLRCDSITSAFAETVASYLRKSKSLQELSLWYSCGGDDGAAAIADALKANETLKKLTLAPDTATLTSKTVVAIAEMLAVNSTLEMVDLFDTCSMEEEQLSFLFEQDMYADVFKRMLIVWKQEFLPQLTKLVREHRNYSQVSVSVTASVDKDHLREFFDAVATNTTLHVLHFYPSDKCFDELADGIACVVKRTTTLKEVQNLMHVEEGCEQQLVRVLDAMKENHSVTTFTMYTELLTHEIAISLSEMLAVNGTLCDVAICEYWGIGSDIVGIILEGLRQNYTLTKLMISWDPDDNVQGIAEMEELLKRNSCLLDQAVRFVTGECTDTGAADAAKKLRASGGLVDKLKELTGKTTEAVLCDIETAISGLSE